RPAPAASAERVRTLAQDVRGATFEVTPAAARFDSVNVGGALYMRPSLPGASVIETPGKPSLPTISLHVAVPDGMSPRLKVVGEDWETRPGLMPVPVARERFLSDDPRTGPVSQTTIEPDPAVYQSAAVYPAEEATLGAGAMVGEWWVVPVRVRPLRWDPRAAAYRVLRSMTLRVDFVPATDRELKGRPAVRPGAQARAWDRVQKGLVKNYESARAFPVRPRSGSLGAARPGASRAGSRLFANPEWKLLIRQTGWVSVSYATLNGFGFPPGIGIADVRVEERGYDDAADAATVSTIPVVARDNNGNGVFDTGDAITFYARGIRDRYRPPGSTPDPNKEIELRYSDVNVYWLTFGTTPSPRPAPIAGDSTVAATVPGSFRDVIRLEQDNVARMAPFYDLSSPKPEAIEYLFWTDGEDGDQLSTPISFDDPDPTQPFRIRARYQGRGVSGVTHHFDVYFRGASGALDTLAAGYEFFDQDIWVLDTGFTIPGSHIAPGATYEHIGQRRNPNTGGLVDGSFAFLDAIEATYNRLYLARNNYLAFTSGGSGGRFDIHVGGFTGGTQPAIEVYDVTDPLAPDSVTSVVVTSTGPGSWQASFQTDATAGERRFVAFVPGSEQSLAPGSVVADVASNLGQPSAYGATSVARAILIGPQAFRSELDRLASYRRAQGYVVEETDITDIYDEFNGGLKSARAIRRYLRHAYLTWTPGPMYVVLAGDASLDYRQHLPQSSFDWVPTYFKFSTIPDNYGNELVAQDTYYSLNLSVIEPGDGDFVPSLSLTRISAGNAAELRDVVDKITAYEAFQPTDSWRGRQILYSDDQYSTGIVATQPYCFNAQESLFKSASQSMATTTASSPGGIGFTNVAVDLKTYTDAVPATNGCKNLLDVLTAVGSTGGATDALLGEMSRGALIFNLETHANRYIISHEAVLSNGSSLFGAGSNGTPDRVQNTGRPWFITVWGCHTNQFADGPFMTRQAFSVDTLDALGEQYFLMAGRGSIGSLGSTGLEYLQSNTTYNDYVARAFYGTPPTPDPAPGEPARARWILGEVMLEAQIENGLSGSSVQSVMNRTVHLFADPMLRMDALPPRVADVTVAGAPFADQGSLTDDSPTDSLALVASLHDEVGIDSVYVTEQDLASGGITLVNPATWSVAFADSSRLATLTGNVRPHVGNYDLQIRAVDVNGRTQIFTLQVRTPIRYLANGVDIVNGVFVENGALLRAEVTAPIPLTPDSLALLIDGIPVAATKTALDATNRRWALEFTASALFTGTHTLQVAIGGRTAGFDQRTFQTTTEFTLRGVAVVDPRVQGAGCGGSIFQYELSAAARSVTLQLYTVAGRRVASIDLPGQSGLNVYCWDGRDSEAHDTARGVYLFRIRATDPTGKSVSRDGRMIRAR
ncbi:MAG: C25 family cysteine peptidase, partial [Bacteroidota bacterium]